AASSSSVQIREQEWNASYEINRFHQHACLVMFDDNRSIFLCGISVNVFEVGRPNRTQSHSVGTYVSFHSPCTRLCDEFLVASIARRKGKESQSRRCRDGAPRALERTAIATQGGTCRRDASPDH